MASRVDSASRLIQASPMAVYRAFLSWLLVLPLLGGCLPTADPTSEEDLQELAIRWAFDAAETDLNPPAAHCLAFSPGMLEEGEDPPDALLDRFRGSVIPVQPLSACRFEGDTRHIVVDEATGEHGLLFTVSPVAREGPDRATIEVGVLQGSLWGAGWRCSLERVDGEWGVSSCRRELDV